MVSALPCYVSKSAKTVNLHTDVELRTVSESNGYNLGNSWGHMDVQC